MKLVLPSEDSQKPDAEAPQAEDAPIEIVGTWTMKHIQAVRGSLGGLILEIHIKRVQL